MKKVNPKSRAYRSVAQACGFHAVCLIGWEGPAPMAFGDNQGGLFVRVTTAKKETMAADRDDLSSPITPIVVHEYVLVPSEAHAKRLRDALDEILMGQQEEQMNRSGRHRWRNARGCWDQDNADPEERAHDRARWWAIVLGEAQQLLVGGASEFPIYDSADDVERIISRKVVRGRT